MSVTPPHNGEAPEALSPEPPPANASDLAEHAQQTPPHHRHHESTLPFTTRSFFGGEPPYTKQPEDAASWGWGTLFHSWATELMHMAAREELTMDTLPQPMRAYRAYNVGVRLSEELQRQQERRHAWDGYVGARVGVRWDGASDGVLRWVGVVQQYGTPRQLYAGVEWRVAPSTRGGCCAGGVWRRLLCRGGGGRDAEHGPGAFHRGEVDGELLFELAEGDSVATCERVEDVVFYEDDEAERSAGAGGAESAGEDHELPRRDSYVAEDVPPPPEQMSTCVALFRVFRWSLLLLGPLRFLVDGTALLTPMALGWYIRLLQEQQRHHPGDSETGSVSASSSCSSASAAQWLSSADSADEAVRPHPGMFTVLCSVLVLFLLSLIRSLAMQKYAQLVARFTYSARSALSACVAAKCMRISQRELQRPELNVGRIVNFLATDVASVEGTFYVLWMTITVPLQLSMAMYMLYRSMGWAAAISLGMLALSLPLLVLLTKLTYRCTIAMSKRTDARLRSVNELLAGIRSIKFMSLERAFEDEINARRAAELRSVRKFQFISITNSLLTQTVPSCTTAAVMIAYYCSGKPMSPQVIYPALSLLGLMDTPFELITYLIGVYSQFFVSMGRLTTFLEADDATARTLLTEAEAEGREGERPAAAVFAEATVSSYKPVLLPTPAWRRDDGETHFELRVKTLLADVDLRIPRGQLTVVLGPTGSGKSTLLDALIGALAVTRGRVACGGRVAYVPQQPWIMNATLRDNVVFFGAADARAFERAVASSQLAADLALLADGAATEIGEKGINLSGGQKARVSLARAVYADRDVYVLDDPLSALDAHVGERVMRECVCGALAGKTRVLATHQVSAAAYADYVVLLEDGCVAFQGTYAAYRQYARVHYDRSISGLSKTSMYAARTVSELGSAVDLSRLNDFLDGPKAAQSQPTPSTIEESAAVLYAAQARSHSVLGDVLTEVDPSVAITNTGEEKAVGVVPVEVYRRYLDACGGWPAFALVIVFFIVTEFVSRSSDLWLSLWSGDMLETLAPRRRLVVYVWTVVLAIFVSPSRDLLCFTDMRRASYELHKNLLRSISTARLAFFDTTPRGRLMNRMSRDMSQVDWDLPVSLDVSFFFICYLVAYLIIMAVSQPLIMVVFVPLVFLYGRIFRFFCTANRELQRLLNISNSPVFAALNEVLTGRWTISTYERQQAMMQQVLQSLDDVFACGYMQCMGTRWLTVRVELLGNVAVSSLALLGVVATQSTWMHINLSLLALSISKASSITAVLSRLITVGASVEASMNCVERVLYYTDHAPAEDLGEGGGSAVVPSTAGASAGGSAAAAGSLELEHVDMRYRPGLPLVLRDVSFAVAPGQKVGVVGRTGSGKSTLLLALLRLVEVCGGRMRVCGRDARDYGVRELRQLFSMIPQDPLLFDGTVRSNVDPFGACGDAAVWAALRQVGMEERVRGEAGGLDGRVQEGGSNYSVGQRQLLCLARALLKRGSAFLLMDEATANVDPALDRQIQLTVQHTFRDYTVVTIAHRLHTVAAYDRILVMDGGRAVEFGSPRELLDRKGSLFSLLVMSLGKGAQQAFRVALDESMK